MNDDLDSCSDAEALWIADGDRPPIKVPAADGIRLMRERREMFRHHLDQLLAVSAEQPNHPTARRLIAECKAQLRDTEARLLEYEAQEKGRN